MALEVYLVRHGKTVFNTVGRLQGWSDSPLTQEGRDAAAALGGALRAKVRFDAAFSSTSPRAVETAEYILHAAGQDGLPLQRVPECREYCFGGFEGERVEAVHEMIACHRGYADVADWRAAYLHGSRHLLAETVSALDPLGLAETEAQFIGRLQKGLQVLVEKSPANGKILLVSHGMAITGILKSIDPSSILYKSVGNATVSRLLFEDGVWQIVSVGEVWTGS